MTPDRLQIRAPYEEIKQAASMVRHEFHALYSRRKLTGLSEQEESRFHRLRVMNIVLETFTNPLEHRPQESFDLLEGYELVKKYLEGQTDAATFEADVRGNNQQNG